MKIVVVDQDVELLNAAKHRLSGEGYEVFTTELESRGLAMIQEIKPDLIVSDVMMPELSGISLNGMFRRFYRKMPVIITAPHAMKQKIITSGNLEEEDVMLKPLNLNELCLRIANVRGSGLSNR